MGNEIENGYRRARRFSVADHAEAEHVPRDLRVATDISFGCASILLMQHRDAEALSALQSAKLETLTASS
ncbi:MAG: hypothetical protein ACR2NX_02775 [Chthoniobacterales bacterium]